ncbi:MAG: OadG family protein [Candidatus Cloacimonetes bacterium]|nr:OadG family protein [Candidatus Cloacimonadota bacterium]
MKKILLVLLILPIFLVAKIEENQKRIEYNGQTTIIELSQKLEIPLKKLKDCLGVEQNIAHDSILKELKIDENAIQKAISEYDKVKIKYFSSIMITGMLIVFLSLVIIGGIINLLKHLELIEKYKNRLKTTKESKKESVIQTESQLSKNSIIAAMTAVFLYEKDVQEQDKMILTLKKAPTSYWKVSRVLPNQEFFKSKR